MTLSDMFYEDFEQVQHATWTHTYVFEQEQDDDIIEVTATVDPYLNLLNFDVVLVDLYGERKKMKLKDYQELLGLMYSRLDTLYSDVYDS